MSLEYERLISLLEFTQQAAKLKSSPVSTIAQHKGFSFYEHQMQGMPGLHLNSEDEVWLSLERLHETRPPELKNAVLQPWVEMTQGVELEPKLKNSTDLASLIAAGIYQSTSSVTVDSKQSLMLEEFEQEALVKSQFKLYLDNRWKPWAEEEKRRRKTIRLYAELFTLKQQLEGGIVEAQIELVWGIGLGIWNSNGTTVSYPMLTQLVEVSLNPLTAAIEVRPRMIVPRLEMDWYAATDNPGVVEVERSGKEFFANPDFSFSPFDRLSFEPLLRTAVTHLDPSGVYWPNEVSAEERNLPKAGENLKVTDTWVIFVRPRSNSIFLQDLESLKKAIERAESEGALPDAIAAIVTDPSTVNDEIVLPAFRGISMGGGSGDATGGFGKVDDLFFPMPFNDEQVKIVQLLEVFDGVVVQGPPGTGKTHTIANVICHYLANGKRVLVTSMKDPALAVLHEKLPDEIKPLAIPLLSSEQAGMRQFEASIKRIASEIQGLDRSAYQRDIKHLEGEIDGLHARLAKIGFEVSQWAKKNLERINLDGDAVEPQDAAREVVEHVGQFEWLPDKIGIEAHYQPQLADVDVVNLREARRMLGVDLKYLGCRLPQLAEFPTTQTLLQVHQDLSRFTQLSQEIESGQVPHIVSSNQEALVEAQSLLMLVVEIDEQRKQVTQANRSWTPRLFKRILGKEAGDLFAMLEKLGSELSECDAARKHFLTRPVTAPLGIENDQELMEAINNLSQGKSPFGLAGLFGKADKKNSLKQISVLGNLLDLKTVDAGAWQYVQSYLLLQKMLRGLAIRWNTLAAELQLDLLSGIEPEHALTAIQHYLVYQQVKGLVALEADASRRAAGLFPSWRASVNLVQDATRLEELCRALQHHLTKNRLANVWVVKEECQKTLDKCSGKVVQDIRDFLADILGNPMVKDAQMQAKWSVLMAELVRVQGLTQSLNLVADVTGRIEASGAPEYAQLLRLPLENTVDTWLPDNWRQVWRLKRLATHLAAIDAHDDLKRLSKLRTGLESELAKTYQDVVVKRTWLKLAENANPSIRAALQAYLNAILGIGAGTGRRAGIRRQAAKSAASQANSAIPCWIMPHYRVSETLPPELGCFDLVIIDEASQSDLTALPALLRAKKVLVVGDDKQVSPEGIGFAVDQVQSLINRFLKNQVPIYRDQMDPSRSIYDLYKVVFARSGVMLKEHFRCVSPIIEYSKREFYNHQLQPLRIPKSSERLDPPLIDIFVEDGYRKSDTNLAEARFIVDEIKSIVSNPLTADRSIGVVSLLGDEQAKKIWDMLTEDEDIGLEKIEQHRITCGNPRVFQGKERDIMFLTMIVDSKQCTALSGAMYEQRFNVAASRARDRMYLVRSVDKEHLSQADKLRRGLIQHFSSPYAQDESRVDDLRKLCESPFEHEVYDELIQRGYRVVPQVKVGSYRIDMVVEGHNDLRLAVECDGDRYHGPDKWADDMQRQRILERAGWVFWRCFAASFVRRRNEMIADLLRVLNERGIEPIGSEDAPRSVHTEQRRLSAICVVDAGSDLFHETSGSASNSK